MAIFSADFNDFNDSFPDDDFILGSDNYSADRDLYSTLLTEAYNKFGVPCEYYLSTFDTDHNKIFGEDGNRYFIRKFPVMAYYILPKELELWSKWGIEGLDNFQMSISKKHFSAVCTSGNYEYIRPKEGDVIQANYNNRYYEIIDVGEEEEMFLQKKHTWILTVSVFKDVNVKPNNSLSADDISNYTDQSSDIFDLSAIIEGDKNNFLYNPPESEKDQNSIWGEW